MKKLISVLLTIAILFSNIALAAVTLSDLLEKGGNYAVNGEFDKAEVAFEIAMKMEPENVRVYEAIKHMCILKGDFEGALRALDTALEYAPGEGEIYLEKAKILYQMGNTYDAEQALLYAEVCGEAPDDEIWISAYNAYYAQGEYERVIQAAQNMSDKALTEIDVDKFTRALIRTGQLERARSLGLINDGLKDAYFEDAIENGRTLSLVPAEPENIPDYPVFISLDIYNQQNGESSESGDMLLCEPAEDGKRVKLTEEGNQTLFGGEITMEDAFVISTSPSGDIRLYNINSITCIVKDGEIMPIALNEKRSAPLDEEGMKNASRALTRLHGGRAEQNGIVWSKDERYFVLTFPQEYLMSMRAYDLMFVDAETGDFIVANCTPKRIKQEGFEHAHLAVFDDAGENIFYYAFVNDGEDREYKSALKKYNIETGSTETLCGYADRDICFPRLHLTADHEIRGIYTPNTVRDNVSLVSFRETADGWTYEKEAFDEISWYQNARGYFADESSGMEDVFYWTNGTMGYLTVANEKLDAPGHNSMILLPVNGNHAYTGDVPSDEGVMTEEFINAFGGYFAFGRGDKEAMARYPAPECMNVLEMTLSPDGYYALLVVQYPEFAEGNAEYTIKTGLCLLDLQTLEYSMIEMPEDVRPIDTSSSDMLWNERNEIILPTASWTLYKLTIE